MKIENYKYKSCIIQYIGDDKELEKVLEDNSDKFGYINIKYNQPSINFKRLKPSDLFMN